MLKIIKQIAREGSKGKSPAEETEQPLVEVSAQRGTKKQRPAQKEDFRGDHLSRRAQDWATWDGWEGERKT